MKKNPKLSEVFPNVDAMRKYEIDLRNGIIKSDGPEDHARMLEALEKMVPISKELQMAMDARDLERAKASVPIPPTPTKTHAIQAVVDMWLAERAKKNGERTVATKGYHLADFMRSVGSTTDINALTKASVVKYKDGLSKADQTGKTIDNKLMSIRDLFKYALGHGLYTCQNANPVDGLFVLTKTERVNKNEPYQPFEKAEIQRFFEPSVYLPRMDAPDLFWGPLLGVYTGMRIGEATQIRVEDIKQTDVGMTYIRVPKSKTVAGIRNIPIPQALLNLGFLDYVEEVRNAGAARLFPHRPFVNGSYSKRLSETMREYLKELEIKKPNDHKSFHSFRVNVSTDLANRGVGAMQSMKLVGHKAGEGLEIHAGYVRDLPDLKDVIDMVQWPIDLAALRYQGQFKAFIGDKKNWADLKPAKKARARSVRT